MIRALAPALVAASALFAACAGGASDSSSAPSTVAASGHQIPATCSPVRSAEPGDYVETLGADTSRRYFVHVPPAYAGDVPMPVVLAFSASAMPGPAFAGMSRLPALADAEGFLLLVLESADGAQQPWNTRSSPDAAHDLDYATAVLDAVVGTYCVDDAQVYAAGYSDGGGMAQAVTCETERIAAIAVVASTYGPCNAETPMLAFHGLADPLVPYEGGAAANQAQASSPVRRAVTEWARGLGCDALATISRPSSEVELSTFKRCRRGDGVVLLYSVIGGGHTWPGSPPLVDTMGFSTQQLDASDEMWRFFAAFPRE